MNLFFWRKKKVDLGYVTKQILKDLKDLKDDKHYRLSIWPTTTYFYFEKGSRRYTLHYDSHDQKVKLLSVNDVDCISYGKLFTFTFTEGEQQKLSSILDAFIIYQKEKDARQMEKNIAKAFPDCYK